MKKYILILTILQKPHCLGLVHTHAPLHLLDAIFTLKLPPSTTLTSPCPSHMTQAKAKEYIRYHCLHWLTGSDTQQAYTVYYRRLSPALNGDRQTHMPRLIRHRVHTTTQHTAAQLHKPAHIYSQKDWTLCEACLVFVYSLPLQPFCGRPASQS